MDHSTFTMDHSSFDSNLNSNDLTQFTPRNDSSSLSLFWNSEQATKRTGESSDSSDEDEKLKFFRTKKWISRRTEKIESELHSRLSAGSTGSRTKNNVFVKGLTINKIRYESIGLVGREKEF